MGKKKGYRGHYCKVCASILPNEEFSGKGHARHICKECWKLSKDEQTENIALNRIYDLYGYSNLSKNNKRMLESYLKDDSQRIREAAEEMLKSFQNDFQCEEQMELEDDDYQLGEWEESESEEMQDEDFPF
jgi:hypothetical protein